MSNTRSPAEWNFRLKVVSAKGIDGEVFEDAVNDLVDMCFPEAVLDEIGVDVITEHMRQESAPEANVERMRETFQSAMVEKVAQLLTKYIDDRSKLDRAISTITTEIRKRHGKLGQSSSAIEERNDADDDQVSTPMVHDEMKVIDMCTGDT